MNLSDAEGSVAGSQEGVDQTNFGQSPSEDKLAFVLMPFDPEFNHIYSELIRPALEDAGFDVRRADDTLDQQNILRTIVHNIDVADLIVAELTTSRPNVFYELGIAHGLRKPVVLLSQDLDGVPFDLRSYNIVTYSTRFDEVHRLKDRLKAIAEGLKDGTSRFGSPVSDFAPSLIGATSVKDLGIGSNEPEDETQAGLESEELGTFDLVFEVEDAITQVSAIVGRLTEMMERFGEQTTELGAEAQTVSGSRSPGSAVQMRKVTNRLAKEIENLGNGIEEEVPGLHASWKRMEDAFIRLLSETNVHSPEDREESLQLLGMLREFRESIGPGSEGLEEARDALAENTGLSRELNVAIRGTVKAMDSLLEELSTGASSLTRMEAILEQRMNSDGEHS